MASRNRDHQFEKEAEDAPKTTSINFKVSSEFKKAFKGYAVAQGISMTDLLKKGFALSQEKSQK